MSEAAVADPEVQSEQLEQEPTKTEAEPTSITEGSEGRGTDSDPIATFQQEWDKALGAKTETPKESLPPEPKLPVETIEEAHAKEHAMRSSYFTDKGPNGYANRLKQRTEALAANMKLTPEETQQLVNYVFEQQNILHGTYDSYSREAWKNAALEALPKETADKFKGLNLTTRKDHYATAYALGKADQDAEYKARIEAGELFTKAQMEAGRAAAQRLYEAELIKQGRLAGTSSGDGVRGNGSATGGLPTPDQWSNANYEQRQAWKKQHGDDVADRIFYK